MSHGCSESTISFPFILNNSQSVHFLFEIFRMLSSYLKELYFSNAPHWDLLYFFEVFFLYIYRYLELVHPIWHRAHFKIWWIYVSFVLTWLLGCGLMAVHIIPTTKVKKSSFFYKNLIFPTTEKNQGDSYRKWRTGAIEFFLKFIACI